MNTRRNYQTISDNLSKAGFFTDHAHADALHVIKPDANRGLCLSYSQVKKIWLINTYIQVHYEIPQPKDIEEICIACLNAKESIDRTLPTHVVDNFSLRLLSKEEHQELYETEH